VSKAEELITSARRAAAVCGVTRFAIRAWIDAGLLPEPPWTAEQLRQVSDAAEPRPGPQAPHGHEHGGHTDAAVRGAGKLKMTLQGLTGERGRRNGFPSRCGSGSWKPFTLATRSGRPFEILD
jgi:hypothetical protein